MVLVATAYTTVVVVGDQWLLFLQLTQLWLWSMVLIATAYTAIVVVGGL